MKALKITPHKAGFKPNLVIKAQARGRLHDPQQIVRVEVEVLADTQAELNTRAAYDLARREASRTLHGAYHVTGRHIGHRPLGFIRIFEVTL